MARRTAQTHPKKVALAERRQKALNLRKTGATMEAIAAVLSKEFGLPKYDRKQVFQDIDAGLGLLTEQCTHDAEELRQLELERLDTYLLRLQPKITLGDVRAIAQAVNISERRCKMLGLDAPIQIQVEDIVNAELTAFIDGLEPLLPREVYIQVLDAVALIGAKAEVAGNN